MTSPLDASTSLPLTDSTPAMSPPVKAKPVTSTTSTVTLNHQGPKAPSSLTTPAKPSRRKSPVRSDLTQSAKANVAAQNKLLRSVHNHKELLKRDIFKRRALLEKELLVEIQVSILHKICGNYCKHAINRYFLDRLRFQRSFRSKVCRRMKEMEKLAQQRKQLR